MTPLLRQVMLLIGSVATVLIVLFALIWGGQAAGSRHTERAGVFFAPSRTHLAQAQHSLVQLRSEILDEIATRGRPDPIPLRFRFDALLDRVDQHVLSLVRLARTDGAGELSEHASRVHRRFQAARTALNTLDQDAATSAERTWKVLEPLRDALAQLERIYEIEERGWARAHKRLIANSRLLIVVAAAVLIIVTVPLMIRLGLGLRDIVRREARARNDLEEAKQNLEVMAMYDDLTQLGNRHLFKARLDQEVASTRRSDQFAALMYIDLDDFKRINDSLGHDAGDAVLKVIGARLEQSVRAGDTVARIGGDEFTVIATDMDHREDAAVIAGHLIQRINEPVTVAGTELVVSASIGIAILPVDGDGPAALMKNADMALYQAKAQGRHGFRFFAESMNREVVARMSMENALRAAIGEQEFSLHYQPQVELDAGRVTCVEALLRWRRTDGTFTPPDEFIPVADATGLITEIGEWVLHRACADVALARRSESPELRVSINVSARQFREPKLVPQIQRALQSSGLPASALEVEITETTLIEDIDGARTTLQALRALGVSVAIDDFGVGYSSLSYLKQLPIDALKIDRSFVRDIETDEADRSIVDAILAMARSLSLRTVAEGIETQGQLRYLASRHCDIGQGYLLSRPAPLQALRIAEVDRQWSSRPPPTTRASLHVVE